MSNYVIISNSTLTEESVTDSGFDVTFDVAALGHILEVTKETYTLDQKNVNLIKTIIFNVEKESFSLVVKNADFTHVIPGDADSATLTVETVYDITLEAEPVYDIELAAEPLID